MKLVKPRAAHHDLIKSVVSEEKRPSNLKVGGTNVRQETGSIKAAMRAMADALSKTPLITKAASTPLLDTEGEADFDTVRRELASLQDNIDGVYVYLYQHETTERNILNALEGLVKALSGSKKTSESHEVKQRNSAVSAGGRRRGTGPGGGRKGVGRRGSEGRREDERPNLETIRESIDAIRDLVQRLASERDSNAGPNVRFNYQDLEVTYVTSDTEDFIGEGRREAQKWSSVAFLCLGAVFGVVVNWVTPTEHDISPLSLIAIVMFSVNGGLAFWSSRRAQRRADECRDKTKGSRRGKSKKSQQVCSRECTVR